MGYTYLCCKLLEVMDTVALLEELRAIVRNGLTYTQNIYDRERYDDQGLFVEVFHS